MKNLKTALLGALLLILNTNVVYSSSLSDRGEMASKTSTFSIDKSKVKSDMAKVANWQIKHFRYSTEGSSGYLHDYGIDAWTNATLYLGMCRWAEIADSPVYYDWLKEIGAKNNWVVPNNFEESSRYKFYHADELCIGQFYLEMFEKFGSPEMLLATKERVERIMNNPPDTTMSARNKQSWTWCDALFMAPPVYARLAKIENDQKYLRFMDEHFKRTYHHLYNNDYKLFYRDASYFGKKENNGSDIFWGRGNGWVAAGLVNILKLLPEDSEYRPFYENLFKEFLIRLMELQDENGYWHASLLDPESYPSPETSVTALIVYAMAYGVNEQLLPQKETLFSIKKAWSALESFISEEGKLGWVQPIGADPKKVTSEMTAVYGVGAYLLAGSELCRINIQ